MVSFLVRKAIEVLRKKNQPKPLEIKLDVNLAQTQASSPPSAQNSSAPGNSLSAGIPSTTGSLAPAPTTPSLAPAPAPVAPTPAPLPSAAPAPMPVIAPVIQVGSGVNIQKKGKKHLKEKTKAVPIPEITIGGRVLTVARKEITNLAEFQKRYPLYQATIDGKTKIFAEAWIHYSKEINSLIYEVIEPPLTEKDKEIIQKTIDTLLDRVELDFYQLKNEAAAVQYVSRLIDEIWKIMKIKLPKEKAVDLKYYVLRDTVGYGKIDPLMRDPYIEDISCDGVGIPVYIFHNDPLIGEIPTNIVFTSDEELDSFVMKLAQRSGRYVSAAEPLLDATLPDGSRIQITYGREISRKGSNFTIRKFRKEPFTPIKLLELGTVDLKMLAYLWLLIEEGKSMLISGGTATGKTTFLNALAMFIPPTLKIVTIEDTAELNLMNPNWVAQVARPGFGPNRYGEVSMEDLLKAALRQRPDWVIVGEVRGREAYVLFQALSTGHYGLGTIHAETIEALINRLTTPPINLPKSLLEALDAVVFLIRTRRNGRIIRRVNEITEIERYDPKTDSLIVNDSFYWRYKDDTFVARRSVLLGEIMDLKGWTEEQLRANLALKGFILKWMYDNGIDDFRRFNKIIAMYYTDVEELIEKIKEGWIPPKEENKKQ